MEVYKKENMHEGNNIREELHTETSLNGRESGIQDKLRELRKNIDRRN